MNFTANPVNGRFISQDTYSGSIDNPGQWHLYAYCANNPINYTDPSGHARKSFKPKTKKFKDVMKIPFWSIDAVYFGYKTGKAAWKFFKEKGWKKYLKSEAFKKLFKR